MSAANTLTDWALSVPLPSGPKAIGRAAVRLVLVALAQYADAEGIAYPAAETLADAIEGMARRDVRNALHVLESAGLIEPAASRKRNRSIRWRLLTEARDNSGRHLTAWALAVPLPSGSKAIGRAAVRLMLVALAQHADADGIAGPSAAALADCIDGMSTRDARNALTALDAADIIEPNELARPGRATRWRILAGDLAGNLAGNLAGDLAGDLAGNLAGYPAMKGSEGKGIEPPYPPAVDVPSLGIADGRGEKAYPPHIHEPNARTKLDALRHDRGLAHSLEQLLSIAYRLGEGNPWAGARIIDGRTEKSLAGSRDPAAVLRARLAPAASDAERVLIDGSREPAAVRYERTTG